MKAALLILALSATALASELPETKINKAAILKPAYDFPNPTTRPTRGRTILVETLRPDGTIRADFIPRRE